MKIITTWRNVAGFIPAILWAVLLALLSLTSGDLIRRMTWDEIMSFDKLAHFGCYCIFGILVAFGYVKNDGAKIGLKLFLICGGFGLLMEVLQLLMHQGRQFDYLDLAANLVGVLVAYCIFIFFLKTK